MLIIGHRGAAGLEAQNTIGSFKKAIELGVDMIETDLRKFKGEIVISHDKVSKKSTAKYVKLSELLKMSSVPLNLELKERGIEAEVLSQIKKFSHKVLISSFQIGILKKVRALDEKVPIGFVIGPKMGKFFPIAIKLAKSVKSSSIHPVASIVTKARVAEMHSQGFKVYAYTVNDPKEAAKLKSIGVDGIFTDYPNLMIKHC